MIIKVPIYVEIKGKVLGDVTTISNNIGDDISEYLISAEIRLDSKVVTRVSRYVYDFDHDSYTFLSRQQVAEKIRTKK